MKINTILNERSNRKMKDRFSWFLSLLLIVAFSNAYSQTTVSTLAQLRAAVQLSNQTITMQPGNYNIEDLSSDLRYFPCSGSNNTITLTGVYIKFPVSATTVEHFLITGSYNTLIGGEFENTYASGLVNVTDYVAYNNDRTNLANGARPHIAIKGSYNSIIGTKMTVRGSFPYGYGSLFGIGAGNTYGLDKRAGVEINGAYTTIDGCELQMQVFGHGIYIGDPAVYTVIKNTLVEGVVRSSNDILAEGATSLPGMNGYKDSDGNAILPNEMVPLCEDGIRMYSGGGSASVENCTVKKMRGGIKLYLSTASSVTNSTSIDCGDVNYNMSTDGTIINSIGNFTNGELCDWAGNKNGYNAEWTILASPNAVGAHNIMDVKGNNHNLVFHRSPGPLDTTTRAIVVTGSNSTILNETEYAIVLASGTSGNVVTSCGAVTDNGSNSVTRSNCTFDLGCSGLDAFSTIQAESYCNMSGIQTETTTDTGGGQDVGYIGSGDWIKFDDVNFGTGAASIDVRVASKSAGGTIQFRLGSATGTLIGTATVPVTGGWQTWTTVNANISGATGTQDLYIVFTAGAFNFNWFKFVAPVCATFSTIQAEAYNSMSGIAIEGTAVSYVNNGDWTMYNNIDLTCATSISVRASSKTSGGTIEVRLGSSTGTLLGTVTVSSTGSWSNWVTSSTNLTNTVSGTQNICLVFKGGSGYLFNIDWLKFNSTSTSKLSQDKDIAVSLEKEGVSVFPNPVTDLLTVITPEANFNQYTIFNINGKVVRKGEIGSEMTELSINMSDLLSGIYILNLNGQETKTLKIIKQ